MKFIQNANLNIEIIYVKYHLNLPTSQGRQFTLKPAVATLHSAHY